MESNESRLEQKYFAHRKKYKSGYNDAAQLENLELLLREAREINAEFLEVRINNYKVYTYTVFNDYNSALLELNESFKKFELLIPIEPKYSVLKTDLYVTAGILYVSLNKYQDAISYFEEAARLAL